jgi:hypothetical protein
MAARQRLTLIEIRQKTDLLICTMKLSTLCATESRIHKINLQKTKFCDCKNNLKQRKINCKKMKEITGK